MKIAIGSDHAAFAMKSAIIEYLSSLGHEVQDEGTYTEERCDYYTYAAKVARTVASGQADRGILICGTGAGMSIAANKIHGIRAVACSEPYTAKLTREHNNTNILCFGARVVGIDLAKMIVDSYLNAEFIGGRHAQRVEAVMELERQESQQ